MSSKLLYAGLAIIVVGVFATMIVLKKPEPPRPGTAQTDHKGGHVQSKKYGGSEPPTSGEHANTVTWGIHKEEVADVNVLHNLEHGGIYVSYRPDTPKEEIMEIEHLFSVPSSREGFSPAKAVVAPRKENEGNIVLSSWNRSETFTSFNEKAMYEYYVGNFNKSPEPLAK